MSCHINYNNIDRKKIIADSILIWGYKNYRKFSWRDNLTPYGILVAELLLRRTTATAVERLYKDFIINYPDLFSLSKANKSDLEYLLKSIGYNKLRACMITEVATDLINNYGGIPCNLEELMTIRNIGSYTAGAIISLGYGKRAVMVDSNVKRIIKRVFSSTLPEKPTDRNYLEICEKLLPSDNFIPFNFALLDFGALICRYNNPLHENCPIKDFCDYFKSISFRSTS